MDIVQDYVKPLKEFAKDSIRLVKRCTKPDLKGRYFDPRWLSESVIVSFRISKDCLGNSCWFCYHGLYWFFCQVNSYTYQ